VLKDVRTDLAIAIAIATLRLAVRVFVGTRENLLCAGGGCCSGLNG
jgi:hypothetical protein